MADAGMVSEASQVAIQAAGLSFILGTRIPYVPQVVRAWRTTHPGQHIPGDHHKRDSIEAQLSIVFAALGVSPWIEHQTGWRIKKFVRAARCYRTVKIRAGRHTLTAANPLPDDFSDVLTKINPPDSAH